MELNKTKIIEKIVNFLIKNNWEIDHFIKDFNDFYELQIFIDYDDLKDQIRDIKNDFDNLENDFDNLSYQLRDVRDNIEKLY